MVWALFAHESDAVRVAAEMSTRRAWHLGAVRRILRIANQNLSPAHNHTLRLLLREQTAVNEVLWDHRAERERERVHHPSREAQRASRPGQGRVSLAAAPHDTSQPSARPLHDVDRISTEELEHVTQAMERFFARLASLSHEDRERFLDPFMGRDPRYKVPK